MLYLLWAHGAGIPSRAPRNNGLWPLRQIQTFSPDSLPASCGTLSPFRLCSRSQPQSSPWDLTSKARASAPSLHPPQWVSRQASQAGGRHRSSVREFLHFALCTPVAALSSVAPKLPPNPTATSDNEGAS